MGTRAGKLLQKLQTIQQEESKYLKQDTKEKVKTPIDEDKYIKKQKTIEEQEAIDENRERNLSGIYSAFGFSDSSSSSPLDEEDTEELPEGVAGVFDAFGVVDPED